MFLCDGRIKPVLSTQGVQYNPPAYAGAQQCYTKNHLRVIM